jgi:hypothetical protein
MRLPISRAMALPTARPLPGLFARLHLSEAASRLALPLICLLPILLTLPFMNEPFEGDEGVYVTVAQGDSSLGKCRDTAIAAAVDN